MEPNVGTEWSRKANSVIVEVQRNAVTTRAAIQGPVSSEMVQCVTTRTRLAALVVSLLLRLPFAEKAGDHVIFRRSVRAHQELAQPMHISRTAEVVEMLRTCSVLRGSARVGISNASW